MENLFVTLLPDQLDGYAPLLANTVMAGLTLIVGMWAAGFAATFVRNRALRSPRIDDTLGNFFASIVRYLIIAFVVIAVLQRFGVEATSLVAVLGAATLAIGFALQGTLANVAAGVMLMLFRPYKLGDFVEIAGQTGSVRDINIFTTELATVDNVKIIIPNGECWGGAVTNYSGHPTRRCDLTFGISYDDDVDAAIALITNVIEADGRALSEPDAPWVRLINLGDSSLDIQMRVWVQGSDYWDFRFKTLKAVKDAFDREGVEIPYPHQVLVQKPADGA